MEIQRPLSKQTMPENAKRVFKGVMFDTYQWEVDGYDGSKKTFEKVKRPDTVMVIAVTEDGRIIISQQEQPGKNLFIGCLGGRVDEGEQPLEAAKRELLEESGCEAKEWVLFDASQPISKIDWAVYVFVAKGCKKVAEQNLDGAERIELMYVDFDKFVEIATNNTFGDIELRLKFLEAKLDPEKMKEIKRLILD